MPKRGWFSRGNNGSWEAGDCSSLPVRGRGSSDAECPRARGSRGGQNHSRRESQKWGACKGNQKYCRKSSIITCHGRKLAQVGPPGCCPDHSAPDTKGRKEPAVIGTLFKRVKDVHFVGIGGVGMSGIAEILLALGFRVSGSDLRSSATTDRLRDLGGRIWIGHHKDHLEKADVVVFSSAASEDNPELRAALDRRIPVIPRAEMLAELMRMQTSIAVAGMHGKTTTTSMIASILSAAGLDPTVVIGGKVNVLGGGARLGRGDLLVAEADESDRTFLKLFPTIAVVTNIEMEHVDCYSDITEIQDAFLRFIERIPFYGYAVVCLDDPEIQKILPSITKRV